MYFYAARQPILDRELKLFAYELLFRDGVNNVFPDIDEDLATSRIIEGSQVSFGLKHFTDNKPAFINFTLETILQNYPSMMPPETLVVEILETVKPGKKLLESVKDLKKQGYVIALDDYEDKPVWKHFFPFIDIIKFDLRAMTLDQISEIMASLHSFPQIKFLAEKVETREEFEACQKLGFSYFQGYFFSRPEVVKAKNLSPAQMTLAELLSETSGDNIDIPKITQIFERDINLAYKLLRYSNSAIFKRRAEISTIKQALVVLGQVELKKFLSLLFTAQINDSKPEVLLKMAMVRARFCELIATQNQKVDASMAFLTGMMSLIDAILDESIEKIMEQLPLAQEIKNALINSEGLLAEILTLTIAFEKGDWEQESKLEQALHVKEQDIAAHYSQAINWADEQLGLLSNSESE